MCGMKKVLLIALGLLACVVGLFILLLWPDGPAVDQRLDPAAPASPAALSPAGPGREAYQGFLYGRVTTVEGGTYEGRLRMGDGGEAFWGDYFNGSRVQNPWGSYVPPERLPRQSGGFEIFGLRFGRRQRPVEPQRQIMVRFGDLARIEARGRDVRVTLKSGAVLDLDRMESSDFDDGLRVWDGKRGVVDLDSLRIRAIELLPTPRLEEVPSRLHGRVRTDAGDFTGFIYWNRKDGLGSDELKGEDAGGKRIRLPFDALRSIARSSRKASLVTLADGREVVLSGSPGVTDLNSGIYVEDSRYGRVLVPAFLYRRVDFSPGGSGPAYDAFPPGRPLTGSVTTRAGRRLAGRLVYDLDESETIETLDASAGGMFYNLLFGRIAAIVPPGSGEGEAQPVRVLLHGGEELRFEPGSDLGGRNAGLLIFTAGRERPEYVPWAEVQRVDLDPPNPGEGFPPPPPLR